MELISKILEEAPTCEKCGKPYEYSPLELKYNGNVVRRMHRYIPTCDCERKEQEAKEKKAQEHIEMHRAIRAKEARQQKAKINFENSMLTPFFREKTFDSLEQTEEIKTLRKYAKEFKPRETIGIQFIGNVGTGKTTALAALCNELLDNGYTCLFTTLSNLLDRFSAYSYSNHGDISQLLQWLTSYDFVVLDDIGRESYTDKRKETAFRIIDTLLNHKVTTAFTANPEMIEKLKRIPEWIATIDRLKDMCKVKFTFTGGSYRGE